MKIGVFLKNHVPYNVGERAGFPDDEADRLVKRGIFALATDVPAPVRDVPNAVAGAPTGKPGQGRRSKG